MWNYKNLSLCILFCVVVLGAVKSYRKTSIYRMKSHGNSHCSTSSSKRPNKCRSCVAWDPHGSPTGKWVNNCSSYGTSILTISLDVKIWFICVYQAWKTLKNRKQMFWEGESDYYVFVYQVFPCGNQIHDNWKSTNNPCSIRELSMISCSKGFIPETVIWYIMLHKITIWQFHPNNHKKLS